MKPIRQNRLHLLKLTGFLRYSAAMTPTVNSAGGKEHRQLQCQFQKNCRKYFFCATISSATRPPGSYILKWDGKDEEGKIVEADTYTIYIEAAREHGTYQLIKQEVVCKGKAQEWVLKGNEEVSAATVSYKKK